MRTPITDGFKKVCSEDGGAFQRHGPPSRVGALRTATLGGAVAMVALATAAQAQQQKIPSFKTPAVFPVGAYPWGIDAADAIGKSPTETNPDGYPDLAVVVGQISVHQGEGTWTGNPGEILIFRNTQDWSPPSDGLQLTHTITLPGNTIPAEVVWADMDGDDRLDLVITATSHYTDGYTASQQGVHVYRWDNNTTAFVPYEYEPSAHPLRGLTVADFDDDGDLDVATAVDYLEFVDDPSGDHDFISVMLNDGTGHLLPETLNALDPAAGDPTTALTHGRFDNTPGGNILPDLFTSRWSTMDGASLTNTGSGAFQLNIISSGGGAYSGIASGRFTLGKLTDDVAAYIAPFRELVILHGNGNGGFASDSTSDIYTIGWSPPSYLDGVAVGNLNGGSRPDIAVTYGKHGIVVFLLGNGDGTFQYDEMSSSYRVDVGTSSGAAGPRRVLLTDFNLDGYDDIATSNHVAPGTISILINRFLTTLP